MADQERIDRAAIWCRGIIYDVPRPGRHRDVIAMMRRRPEGADLIVTHQGFTTTHERFVDRVEALKIARAAGQLLTERVEDDGTVIKIEQRGDKLFSEDVW